MPTATTSTGSRLQDLRGGSVAVVRRALNAPGSARGLADAFRDLGVAAADVSEVEFDPAQRGVVCFCGNANWFPASFARLAAMARDDRPFVVVWHSEPLPFPSAAELPRPRLHARELAKVLLRDARATDPHTNARRLRRLAQTDLPDLLAVSTAGGQEYLMEIGLQAHHVPLGYSPGQGCDLALDRDIDALFLGALDVPRRKRAIRELRRRGVRVEAVGGWGDQRFWGVNRTRLLNRTKIVLNISRHEGQFSGARLILGMANGALVVSEPMYRPEPFVPGSHYAECSLDGMPDAIERFLVDTAAREQIATNGHRFVTSELTRDRSVARIVELIRG